MLRRNRQLQILRQQARSDSRRLKDDWQSTARMSTASHQIDPIHVLEPVSRTKTDHLTDVVSQIERRSPIDLVLVLPIGWSEHALDANPSLDIDNSNLLELPEHAGETQPAPPSS